MSLPKLLGRALAMDVTLMHGGMEQRDRGLQQSELLRDVAALPGTVSPAIITALQRRQRFYRGGHNPAMEEQYADQTLVVAVMLLMELNYRCHEGSLSASEAARHKEALAAHHGGEFGVAVMQLKLPILQRGTITKIL